MNNLSTILAGIACLFGLAAWVTSHRAVKYASDACEFCEKNNKASVSLKKMTALEVEMTEITDSVGSLHTSLHKLRSRIGMRDLAKRRKEEDSNELPDPAVDRDGWKREMRKQLAAQKANGE